MGGVSLLSHSINYNYSTTYLQGEILYEGNERFVISGENGNRLTVVNFTEDLDETIILCRVGLHGNRNIVQFTLLLSGRHYVTCVTQ